jgi:peptide chain release factor 1
MLIGKLRTVETRYEELTAQLADPETVSDSKRYQKTAKAHAELGQLVSKFREYKDLERGIAETKGMIRDETDPELKVMAEEELSGL